MKRKTAFTIGRYSPPHKGHINTFLWLLREYEKLIIGIGSCYEVGTSRHPLLAFLREKMIHRSLVNAGVDMSRVTFVHLQDFKDNWEGWWQHVTSIPGIKNVEALVTGNFEQIIGEIEKRKIKLPFKLVNPETELPKEYEVPYHATDLRNAISVNDYELCQTIAATGTMELMGHVGGFAGIREALDDRGMNFIPGRQAVDLIVTCKGVEQDDGRLLLCGFRKKEKENFPGYLAIPGGAINEYENPMDAAVREFKEETGLRIDIMNRYLEPAHVIVHGRQPVIGVMQFAKLFSTTDPNLGGNEGGSSQVFCIHLDCGPEQFDSRILSRSDLESVAFRTLDYALDRGLAYQQTDMVREALRFI